MEERPGDLDSLFETHVPKLRHAAGESADAYALASFALNFAMTEMCSNRVLVDLLVSISLRTLRYVRIGLASNRASIPDSLKSWEALRRAVAKRDMTLVLATARQRMDGSRDSALRAMKPDADVTQKAGSGPKRSARAAQSRRPSTPQA